MAETAEETKRRKDWEAYTKIEGKEAKAIARREWLSKLDAMGLAAHEKKRAGLKKVFEAGSVAAKARGLKSKATLEAKSKEGGKTRLNKLTKRQEEMLEEAWNSGFQPGINGMYSLLKIQYGGKEKVPTQRNIALWLKTSKTSSEKYQMDLRPKKSLTIQSGDLKITRPFQSLSLDLTQFGVKTVEGKGDSGVFVLNLMDVFSRKLYSRFIGPSNGNTITKALRDIFKENKRANGKPLGRILSADNEFNQAKVKALLAKEGIKLLPNVSGRAVVSIERMNQTQGTLLRKYRDKKGGSIQQAVPKIQKLINSKLKNRTTGMTPDEVHALDAAGLKALATKIVTRALERRDVKQGPDDVEVGDKVRLKETKKFKGTIGAEGKFFTNNWSRGVYVIETVRRGANQIRSLDLSGNVGDATRATTYKVKDSDLSYTRNDIQKVPKDTPTTDELNKVEAKKTEKRMREAAEAKEKRRVEKEAQPKKDPRKYRYDNKAYILAQAEFFDGTPLSKIKRRGTIQRKGTNLSKKSRGVEAYEVIWDDNLGELPEYDRESVDDLNMVSLASMRDVTPTAKVQAPTPAVRRSTRVTKKPKA